MPARGFTLIELAIAAGLAAMLLSFALPSFQARMAAARRADATVALERIQIAQERHRSLHGFYASDLAALGSGPLSPERLYDVALVPDTGDRYRAVARARAGSPQAADADCPEITLRVEQGFATQGPALRCWNR